MIDYYKCKCGKTITYEKKYGKPFPQTTRCKCGRRAKRVIGSSNIIVPFHMKSTST